MKFKKFISTLITVTTIAIAVGALVKRILIHGDDLKNIVKRKHDVIKDVGVKTSGKNEMATEGDQTHTPQRKLKAMREYGSGIYDTTHAEGMHDEDDSFDQESYMFGPRSRST